MTAPASLMDSDQINRIRRRSMSNDGPTEHSLEAAWLARQAIQPDASTRPTRPTEYWVRATFRKAVFLSPKAAFLVVLSWHGEWRGTHQNLKTPLLIQARLIQKMKSSTRILRWTNPWLSVCVWLIPEHLDDPVVVSEEAITISLHMTSTRRSRSMTKSLARWISSNQYRSRC